MQPEVNMNIARALIAAVFFVSCCAASAAALNLRTGDNLAAAVRQ